MHRLIGASSGRASQGDKSEAARVIFMGWPGQHELEEDAPVPPVCEPDAVTGPAGFEGLTVLTGQPETSPRAGTSTSAQPPLALAEDRVRAQNGRQLACVAPLGFAGF